MSDKWFLDTNILVYAYDTYNEKKQRIAQGWIEKAFQTNKTSISAQVLGEFYVVVTQRIKNPLAYGEAKRLVELFSNMEVVEIDRSLVHQSLEIHHECRTSYWDAMIIAAAERAGCFMILSEDLNDGQRYKEIEIRNPFRNRGAGIGPQI